MESENNYSFSEECEGLHMDFPHVPQNEGIRSLGWEEVEENLEINCTECEVKFDRWQNCGAKEGDLIEIKRKKYCHWAVSVGNDEIIHLTDGKDGMAIVLQELLKDVVKDSTCRVNNLEKEAERRRLIPRSVEEILETALHNLRKRFEYDPFKFNCEHFATGCYFGQQFSLQAEAAKGKHFVKKGARIVARSYMEAEACCGRHHN
jgi:hypothetical protein